MFCYFHIDIVTSSAGAYVGRGTTPLFTLSDLPSAMTMAMNLAPAGLARARLRRQRLDGIWFRPIVAIVTWIRTYFTLEVTTISVVGCIDVFAASARIWFRVWWAVKRVGGICDNEQRAPVKILPPDTCVPRAGGDWLIGASMAFVYKQKHMEDGIPVFRVNQRSCCSRYTGLSGSKD